jgi:hypothetical protein
MHGRAVVQQQQVALLPPTEYKRHQEVEETIVKYMRCTN